MTHFDEAAGAAWVRAETEKRAWMAANSLYREDVQTVAVPDHAIQDEDVERLGGGCADGCGDGRHLAQFQTVPPFKRHAQAAGGFVVVLKHQEFHHRPRRRF